jgi:glycosyltransferase involved in cell wall biosynthesis
MGSFFYFSGLPEVIKAMRSAPENVKLVLVGGGQQEARLQRLVEKHGSQHRILFTGFVSFDLLPAYLKLADIAINPMDISLVSNTAFPNKVIQYLAAGVPVVSTKLESLHRTFPNSPALCFVSSPVDVVAAALDMISTGKSADDISSAAIGLVAGRFDLETCLGAFEYHLLNLLSD